MAFKKETRVLGIDDAHFERHGKLRECLVVGVIYRGGSFMDGVLSTTIDVDGDNATQNIAAMINGYAGKRQLHAVFLNGIAVGGFNVVDIHELHEKIKLPVIAIVRRKPDLDAVLAALTKLKKTKEIGMLERIGEPLRVGNIYMQCAGIAQRDAIELIALTATRSNIPEPIRIAHLIGQGIVLGKSKGRA